MNEYTTELIKAQESYVLAHATDQVHGYSVHDETVERLETKGYLDGLVIAGIIFGAIVECDWSSIDARITAKVQELCDHQWFSTSTHPFEDNSSIETCDNCDKVLVTHR